MYENVVPNVYADVGTKPNADTVVHEEGNDDSVDDQPKKKPKKEKIGFRDRKVTNHSFNHKIHIFFDLIIRIPIAGFQRTNNSPQLAMVK